MSHEDQPAPLRVALVEDDTRTRQAMSTLLQEEGWQVEAFERAEQALVRLRQARFHALVTDHILPGMKGLELVLSARREDPSLRCAVISGTSPLGDALAQGVRWFTKPVNFDALVEEIAGHPAAH